MGLDIEIWIRAEPTVELLSKLRLLRAERNEDSSVRYPVIDSVFAEGDHVRISSCMRYFGRYYPRGWWPSIRESLQAIRGACPTGTVIEYGNDGSDQDFGSVVDDDLLATLDAEWDRAGRK